MVTSNEPPAPDAVCCRAFVHSSEVSSVASSSRGQPGPAAAADEVLGRVRPGYPRPRKMCAATAASCRLLQVARSGPGRRSWRWWVRCRRLRGGLGRVLRRASPRPATGLRRRRRRCAGRWRDATFASRAGQATAARALRARMVTSAGHREVAVCRFGSPAAAAPVSRVQARARSVTPVRNAACREDERHAGPVPAGHARACAPWPAGHPRRSDGRDFAAPDAEVGDGAAVGFDDLAVVKLRPEAFQLAARSVGFAMGLRPSCRKGEDRRLPGSVLAHRPGPLAWDRAWLLSDHAFGFGAEGPSGSPAERAVPPSLAASPGLVVGALSRWRDHACVRPVSMARLFRSSAGLAMTRFVQGRAGAGCHGITSGRYALELGGARPGLVRCACSAPRPGCAAGRFSRPSSVRRRRSAAGSAIRPGRRGYRWSAGAGGRARTTAR